MELDKILIEKINEEIYKALGVSESLFGTTTGTTINNCAVSLEDIKLAIEKVIPEHAILLSNYVPNGTDIFEIENPLPNKYYCKKLLLVNTYFYDSLFERILSEYGCNIRVYK